MTAEMVREAMRPVGVWVLACVLVLLGALGYLFSAYFLYVVAAIGFLVLGAALAGAAAVRSLTRPSNLPRFSPQPLFVADENLGWIPRPSSRIRAVRSQDGKTVYDVTYTIDPKGARHTPKGQQTADTVLFLGDSFMFGDGVNDDETLPAEFALQVAERFNVVNLGVSAYGPHQVLAQIETGWVEKHVPGGITKAFMWFHYGQLARSTGEVEAGWWWVTAPCYELDPDGNLTRSGTIGEMIARRGSASPKSDRTWTPRKLFPAMPRGQQLVLAEALLRRIRQEVEKRYGAEFAILFWTKDWVGRFHLPRIEEICERAGAKLIVVHSLLDQAGLKPHDMVIKGDGHPAPQLNRFLGKLLAESCAMEADRRSEVQRRETGRHVSATAQ